MNVQQGSTTKQNNSSSSPTRRPENEHQVEFQTRETIQKEMMKGIQTGVNNILIFNIYKFSKIPFQFISQKKR